jgi:hypothetical protein
MAKLRDNQVVIQFGANISGDVQAKAMMQFEKWLRTLTSQDIEVFKEVMGDDSKLRAKMSDQQRAKL